MMFSSHYATEAMDDDEIPIIEAPDDDEIPIIEAPDDDEIPVTASLDESERSADPGSKIPLKPDRLLFAEDLVCYISKEFYGISYTEARLKDCHELLYNAFNETVKEAVHFIRWQIVRRNTLSFEVIEKLCESSKHYYKRFVEEIFSHYSEGGFDAGLFLYYCVYFAELASMCYMFDFQEILDFAVYAILDAFCMLNEGWDDLNIIAEKIARLSKDRATYPDYKPSIYNQPRILNPDEDTQPKDLCHKSEDCGKVVSSLEKCELVFSLSSNEPNSEEIEQLSNSSADMLCMDEIEYLQDLALEARLVVSYEASMFSAVLLCRADDVKVDPYEESLSELLQKECMELSEVFKLLQIDHDSKNLGLVENKCVNETPIVNEETKNAHVQATDTSTKVENEAKAEDSNDSGTEDCYKILEVEDKLKSRTEFLVHYEPECKADTGDLILLEADRLMFAEDLVGYISKEFYGIPYSESRVKESRETLYNAFNEPVKQAVHFIGWQIEKMNELGFEVIENLSESRKHYYRRFVNGVLSHYSRTGFNAGLFLHYCVYFAQLASRCYRFDFPEVLDFAVYCILDAFCMLTEEWDYLNIIAEKIVRLSNDRTIYPDYKPSHHDQRLILNPDDEDAGDVVAQCLKAYLGNPKMEVQKMFTKLKEMELSKAHHNMLSTNCENVQLYDISEELEGRNTEVISSLEISDKVISSLEGEASSQKSEQLFDPLWKDEMKYLQDLVLEAKLIVSHEASMFATLFTCRGSNEKVDSPHFIEKELIELRESVKFLKINLKDLVFETDKSAQQSPTEDEKTEDEHEKPSSSADVIEVEERTIFETDKSAHQSHAEDEKTEDQHEQPAYQSPTEDVKTEVEH